MTSITQSTSWKNLENHHKKIQKIHMKDLFENDPNRFDKFHINFDKTLIDFSKHRVTDETIPLLLNLAREANIEAWREKLFSGEKINFTEQRSVLHTALRNSSNQAILVDGHDVMPDIKNVLDKMQRFSESVRNGSWMGFSGKKIQTIVNIGIGGSDLGPAMVCKALKAFGHPDIDTIFVSNVDGADISQALEQCDPETTLFIVASKTFSTQETMTNAFSAREWFLDKVKDEKAIAFHFVAVSTNAKAMRWTNIS
jgi:glucose-6-phosphate isomerase